MCIRMTLCSIHALLSSIILLASSTSNSAIAQPSASPSLTTSTITNTTLIEILATVSNSSSLNINRSIESNNNHNSDTQRNRHLSSFVPTTIHSKFASTNDQKVPNFSNNHNNGDNFASGIAGYLLAEASSEKLNNSNTLDSTLASILSRTGPDMRPLRDFEDFDDITVDVAKRAWQLMHEHAQTALVDKFQLMGPIVVSVLKSANVSNECIDAAVDTMKAAQQLDSWAIQLLTTWGNFPPTGIYEGTFGDIGSYHGCINVPQNPIIGHAHYCTIAYRPVMPTRRNYELIVRKEPDELLKLFDRDDQNQSSSYFKSDNKANSIQDAFTDILNNAQYSHYIYYKFGTCFPIKCSPFDVSKLAKLLGKRSILMSGPVKCHSKYEDDYEYNSNSGHNTSSNLQISIKDMNDGIYIWKPHMTRTQFVALLILGLISSIIIMATIIDGVIYRVPILFRQAKAEYDESKISCDNTSIKNHAFLPGSSISKNSGANCDNSKFSNSGNYMNLNELSKSSNSMRKSVPTSLKSDLTQSKSLDNNIFNKHDDLETNKHAKSNQYANRESRKLYQNGNTLRIQKQRSLLKGMIKDFSIITNTKQFFEVNQSQLKNDITCLSGVRVTAMVWIIITHTMQYNDWSAFARTREIETHLQSLINQPLFNGSYLVDTFFLMSGLLTSYSSFKSKSNVKNSKGIAEDLMKKFSTRSYLIGRYLRLTPQIMFVSILFILLPQLSRSGGPHWYTITGEYSENCSQNWWVNLFHIQAFYHTNEMCNFVCWWISVDMFYHLFALVIILFILYCGHRVALLSCSILILSNGIIQAMKHYQLGLPPNLLSTIPQTGAMWSKMTLEFFWTPYAHAFPYFLGFYIGYLMAQRHSKLTSWFNINRAIFGWLITSTLLVTLSYSTYFWVIGKWQYTRIGSTIFCLTGPIIWSTCLGWIILACQYGYGSWINHILSCKLFIILGKASYIVYLSHFLVLFTFFGSQNLLLEPTQLVMFYVILGNICLSMLLGSFLCVVFEMPWLKTQRRLMKYVH